MSVIQRNIRQWLSFKAWQWWKLFTRVKPLLSVLHAEEELKAKEEEMNKAIEELKKIKDITEVLATQNVGLGQAKDELEAQLQIHLVSGLSIEMFNVDKFI